MTVYNGMIKHWTVRVFRWNKKMASYAVSRSQGIFMVRVKNTVKGRAYRTEQKQIYPLNYEDFRNPETMEDWLWGALNESGFFPIRTIKELTKKIPTRLLRKFKFQVDENGPEKPVLVVLLDVDMVRRKGCTRSGPRSAGKKEKPRYGDPIDEELESVTPEAEQIDDWLLKRLDTDWSLGPVVEEPIAPTEPRGLYQVRSFLAIKKSDGRGLAEDEECPICFEKVCNGETGVATTPCSHVFHWDCLSDWLPMNGACPICRSYCTTIV